jgi:hypothetical protein
MSLQLVTSAVTTETIKAGFVTAASFMKDASAKISPVASKFFLFYTLYSMYEAALSDIFCLKTFRHGTSPYAAARIAWTGPDLKRAGQEGEAAYYKSTTGQESVWARRDQDLQAFYVVEDVCADKRSSIVMNYMLPKFTAKAYSLRSTVTFIGSLIPLPNSWKGGLIKKVVQVIETDARVGCLSFLCPTVKFHLHPDRVKDINTYYDSEIDNAMIFYKDEPSAGDGALYTTDQFSVLDIGIVGVLKNGIGSGTIKRIQENRNQFLWGIAQLVTAVAFTAFFIPGVIPGGWVVVSAVTSILALGRFGAISGYAMLPTIGPFLFYAGFQL